MKVTGKESHEDYVDSSGRQVLSMQSMRLNSVVLLCAKIFEPKTWPKHDTLYDEGAWTDSDAQTCGRTVDLHGRAWPTLLFHVQRTRNRVAKTHG